MLSSLELTHNQYDVCRRSEAEEWEQEDEDENRKK